MNALKFSLLLCLSSCGFSSPGGYILGTTSYLREWNHGQKSAPEIREDERQEMNAFLEKEYGGHHANR